MWEGGTQECERSSGRLADIACLLLLAFAAAQPQSMTFSGRRVDDCHDRLAASD